MGQSPPQAYGSFQAVGRAGAGQSDTFRIFTCEADPQYVLKHNSCHRLSQTFHLNAAYQLPEVTFIFLYGDNGVPFQVAADIPLNLHLSRLVIGKPSASMKVRVFSDFTNHQELKSLVTLLWGAG